MNALTHGKRWNLAAKSAAAMALSSALMAPAPVSAGIPVFDGVGLVQAIFSVLEQVSQGLQQIQQYRTQLQQYENMIQNTLAPAQYIWDQANGTINSLRGALDDMDRFKRSLGSIDAYMAKFQDESFYKNSPCYQASGCTPQQQALLDQAKAFGSEAQKKANDAQIRSLDAQLTALGDEARNLTRLQGQAQGASGQLEAIAAANQLAGNQANQLLQIRSLLVAEQTQATTRMQFVADKEAQEAAAAAQLRRGTYRPSTNRAF